MTEQNVELEYLRWRIEKVEEFNDSMAVINAEKAAKIQALQADLETAKAEIQELRKQREESDAEKKKL